MTNTNARGSYIDRARRKFWLLTTFGDGTLTVCWRCGVPLLYADLTADRVLPGAHGGTYCRANLRPACRPCQNEQGWMMARGYE